MPLTEPPRLLCATGLGPLGHSGSDDCRGDIDGSLAAGSPRLIAKFLWPLAMVSPCRRAPRDLPPPACGPVAGDGGGSPLTSPASSTLTVAAARLLLLLFHLLHLHLHLHHHHHHHHHLLLLLLLLLLLPRTRTSTTTAMPHVLPPSRAPPPPANSDLFKVFPLLFSLLPPGSFAPARTPSSRARSLQPSRHERASSPATCRLRGVPREYNGNNIAIITNRPASRPNVDAQAAASGKESDPCPILKDVAMQTIPNSEGLGEGVDKERRPPTCKDRSISSLPTLSPHPRPTAGSSSGLWLGQWWAGQAACVDNGSGVAFSASALFLLGFLSPSPTMMRRGSGCASTGESSVSSTVVGRSGDGAAGSGVGIWSGQPPSLLSLTSGGGSAGSASTGESNIGHTVVGRRGGGATGSGVPTLSGSGFERE
uniref:Uncharacterized protein n=1 Tax=Oryza punctata TaxID=4537 RepID=A0A0E0KDW1_ORYPU